MRAASVVLAVGLSAVSAFAQQLCGDLTITRTENNVLSLDPWEIAQLTVERCDSLSLETGFFTVGFNDPDANNSLGLSWNWKLPDAVDTVTQIVEGGWKTPLTSFQVVCTQREVERLVTMSGSVSQYAFHIGAGGPRGRDARGTFCGTKTYRVFAPLQTQLEIPFHVSGDVLAAESFGNPNSTYGKAKLELSGSVDGVGFGPLTTSVESVSVIPNQASANQTLNVAVVAGPGATDVSVSFSGEVEVITRAQSTGLFGMISGAATAAADFPNTVYVGNFRAAGGGALPPCVSVSDANSGAEYAWTNGTAYCTAKTNSQGCTPSIESSGTPSASGFGTFVISARDVLNQQSGMLIYGLSGRQAAPFQGGTLCLRHPKRTKLMNSGGSPLPAADCSGTFSIDMNLYAAGGISGATAPAPELQQIGTRVNCQWWSRDSGFAPPQNTSLSDALEYDVCQ